MLNKQHIHLSTVDQDSQPRPILPQSDEDELLTEENVVQEIKILLGIKNTQEVLQQPFSENHKTRLNMLKNLYKKGKAVGYMTKNDEQGTVFHYEDNWLCTCSHVVENEEYLSRMTVTFKWINLESGTPVTREYTPSICGCLLPCGHNHRKGIITNITENGKESDLAMFREDLMDADPQLPSIQLHYSVTVKYEKKAGSIKEKITIVYIANGNPRRSNDIKFYHIFWKFESSSCTKWFHISNGTTQTEFDKYGKDIGLCFLFNSPAPKGASGSPVMIYQKFEQDSIEKFFLAGVMKGGWKYVQVAESTEAIRELIKKALSELIAEYELLLNLQSRVHEIRLHRKIQVRKSGIRGRFKVFRPDVLEKRREILQNIKKYIVDTQRCMSLMEDLCDLHYDMVDDVENMNEDMLTFEEDMEIMMNIVLEWQERAQQCILSMQLL